MAILSAQLGAPTGRRRPGNLPLRFRSVAFLDRWQAVGCNAFPSGLQKSATFSGRQIFLKNVIAQGAHLLVEIHGWVVRKLLLTLRLNYDKYGKHQMTTPTTNRFITKALRILCCAIALTACSTWATVVTWQLSSSVGTTKDLSQSGYTTTASGVSNTPATDASNQLLFKTAPVSETTAVAGSLNNRLQVTDSDNVQQDSASIVSSHSKQSAESLFAASNTQASSTAPLGGAIAAAFDEEFISVPTVQFASMGTTTSNAAAAALTATDVNTDPAPVPEMSALFPIVGLIAAVSCTQILRRRRAAQQSAPRSLA
jgi:hypothetical protein